MPAKKKNGSANNGAMIKAESTELAYLKKYEGHFDSGVDGINPDDMPQPRIKVRHAMSKLTREEKDLIAEGDFYHTITKESFGSKIEIFPILFWKSLVWFNKEDQTFQAARHFYQFGEINEIQDVGEMRDQINDPIFRKQEQESYNIILAFADAIHDMGYNGMKAAAEPVVFSTRSASNAQVRKVFNPTVKMDWARHSIPLTAHKVQISTLETTFKNGVAWVPYFDFIGYADEKEFSALNYLVDIAKKEISKKANDVKNAFE